MKTAIATVCLSGGLQEKLEAAAAAGFRAVEIFENDLIAFPGSPEDVRRMAADLGLSIIAFQPFRDFEGMPADKRQRTFDRAERKFDLMQTLGADLMLVCSNVAPDALGGIDRLAQDFTELGERAAKRGLRIGYEALAWGRHINDYRDAWEVVRRADHKNVGIILDSFHILARGTDLGALRAIPKDRIFLVQVADAPLLQMELLSWSRHWRCMPGQGDFDLTAFTAALAETGFDGHLSLEIFNDRFRAGSARSVAVDGHRSLINLLDATSRSLGRTIAGTPDMPKASAIAGVEFIEFAVEEVDRPQFETMLMSLGFRKTGQHRSKDVRLWTQGDIRIVLNSEAEGFAHSYQITHGTSVCAMALAVDDAQATVARAAQLLDHPYRGPIGPNELDIPAVRGLGGSLIYFMDRKSNLGRWSEVDFTPVDAPDSNGAGLLGIDHISQTMQYEEMLTWVLFYSSLFRATKTPSQAVIDPGGVVQSQVIESGVAGGGPGGLRLVLNGSQSHRTLAAQFVTDFFGSGVQHIAFRCRDIFATARTLAANGLGTLPIPENYYDDLEARTDLGAERLAELRRHNILYDRDAHGGFYQIYTRSLKGGFFFEIIQRDDYRGYGAPNAGVRIAAQAREASRVAMP